VPVVDASVVVDWLVPGIDPELPTIQARRRLKEEGAVLLAPRLLLVEAASALMRGLRRRRWSGVEADRAFRALRRLPLHLVDDARYLDRAWELARRYDNHPVYDMVYVAVAERASTELITADNVLQQRLAHLPWVIGPAGRGSSD
jgi:predicted nucleic acid-binding protein